MLRDNYSILTPITDRIWDMLFYTEGRADKDSLYQGPAINQGEREATQRGVCVCRGGGGQGFRYAKRGGGAQPVLI